MKVLLVRNLSGKGFPIEVKPQGTIADVKRTIEMVRGADVYPAARQMLFYRGKVLADDGSTLEENNVTGESFIVVMLEKPRVAPIVQATEFKAQPVHTQCRKHLQGHRPSGAATRGADNNKKNRAFVLSRKQIQGLRAAAKANPRSFLSMLQELGIQDPELRGLIQDNEAAFLRFLDRPVPGGEGNAQSQQAARAHQLTPEENEAIGRLEAMGFDRRKVLRAFFACNRNEQDAADYLVKHAKEDVGD